MHLLRKRSRGPEAQAVEDLDQEIENLEPNQEIENVPDQEGVGRGLPRQEVRVDEVDLEAGAEREIRRVTKKIKIKNPKQGTDDQGLPQEGQDHVREDLQGLTRKFLGTTMKRRRVSIRKKMLNLRKKEK